jgi:hypothetical protein
MAAADAPEQLQGELWKYALTLLPGDLELTARTTGALRRARGVPDAETLLRLFLVYGVTRLGLKGVAAWAEAAGVAHLSAPSLMERLRNAVDWLAGVLATVLQDGLPDVPGFGGYRLRIVDATRISGPGAKGTDWRVHVVADPVSGRLTSVQITDARDGETLAWHPLGPGDLVLADRGYGHARGMASAVRSGAQVLVRIQPGTIRLCDRQRQPVRWSELQGRVPAVGLVEFRLLLPEPPLHHFRAHGWRLEHAEGWTPVRVLAIRTRDEQVLWLLTTVPADRLPGTEAAELYRLRWQIELLFKRLKSLLDFDRLPARTDPLARAWLLARLLAAVLIERLLYVEPALSPWGYRLRRPSSGTA